MQQSLLDQKGRKRAGLEIMLQHRIDRPPNRKQHRVVSWHQVRYRIREEGCQWEPTAQMVQRYREVSRPHTSIREEAASLPPA